MTPGTIAVYGRTKLGKTVDANRCFANALVLQLERGAITSVQSFLGREPIHVDCLDVDKPYEQVVAALNGPVAKAIKQHGVNAIILDTGSDLADRIFFVEDNKASHQGMVVYPRVGGLFRNILRRALNMGLWTVAIFHEQEPKTVQGRFSRGGPKLPGKLVEDTPGMFDLILHAELDMSRSGSARRVYTCNGLDSTWVTGDRFGAARSKQPMDLRLIMYRILRGQRAPDEVWRQWGHDPTEWKEER